MITPESKVLGHLVAQLHQLFHIIRNNGPDLFLGFPHLLLQFYIL